MAKKNLHIKNLYSPVPMELRLEIYKEALTTWLVSPGLCLLLPKLLWGLVSIFDNGPDGQVWPLRSTSTAFPELNLDALCYIESSGDKEATRKYLLEQWIGRLESELKNQ